MVRFSGAVIALSGLSIKSAAAAMDVGEEHVCATIGSTPKCWGDNKWGQLGREDNATMIGDEPEEMGENLVAVDLGGTVIEMALGEDHTCMLLDSGEVQCFGKNSDGQLGLGDTENRGNSVGDLGVAADLGSGVTAEAVSAGCRHTCVLLDDGTVKCFGYNNYGQLGQGSTNSAGDEAGTMGDNLATVPLDGVAVGIAAGCDFSCALMDGGAIMCWGRNTWGQLGVGDSNDRLDGSGLELAAVDLDGSVASAIAAGEGHVCALLDDATVKCWGRNNNGQLGQGDNVDVGDTPASMGAGLPAIELASGDVPVAVDCGSFHTCLLLGDGSIKCFGENGYGQLGIGSTENVGLLPTDMGANLTAVGLASDAEDVAGGGSTTCAVLVDESVMCWGLGSAGQLGQGSDDDIIDLTDVEAIDLGEDPLAPTTGPTPAPSFAASAAPTASNSSASAAPSAAPSTDSRQARTRTCCWEPCLFLSCSPSRPLVKTYTEHPYIPACISGFILKRPRLCSPSASSATFTPRAQEDRHWEPSPHHPLLPSSLACPSRLLTTALLLLRDPPRIPTTDALALSFDNAVYHRSSRPLPLPWHRYPAPPTHPRGLLLAPENLTRRQWSLQTRMSLWT
ncbi:unnamed protein product [Scytosiphon promiscuus]